MKLTIVFESVSNFGEIFGSFIKPKQTSKWASQSISTRCFCSSYFNGPAKMAQDYILEPEETEMQTQLLPPTARFHRTHLWWLFTWKKVSLNDFLCDTSSIGPNNQTEGSHKTKGADKNPPPHWYPSTRAPASSIFHLVIHLFSDDFWRDVITRHSNVLGGRSR